MSTSTPRSAVSAAKPALATLDTIVKAARNMPVAPEVLPKLQSKLLDVDTDVADLAALIKLDSGLASNVLRVSNSAYYSRASNISSIEEAVTLIGYQETLRLVARCSYATVMKGELASYGVRGEELWEDAVLTAFSMEQLCTAAGQETSEGYITGLLHSMGMIAINDFLQRSTPGGHKAPQGTVLEVVQWERDTLGYHRGEVGAALMRQWHFPVQTLHAVERQFEMKVRPEDGVLAALLPVASVIATHVRLHADAEEEAPPPEFDLERATHAGLDLRQLLDVIELVRSEWARTRQFLR